MNTPTERIIPEAVRVPVKVPDHTLLRVIGRGSYGEVWEARNVMGTPRAVKTVRRDDFDSARPFDREFEGIQRYGQAMVPMDEALCLLAIDISGRPNLVWKTKIEGKIGTFDVEVIKEFFKGFVNESRCTLHVNILYGENLHHKVEAIFKAFAKALRQAVTRDERIKGALSTKGSL